MKFIEILIIVLFALISFIFIPILIKYFEFNMSSEVQTVIMFFSFFLFTPFSLLKLKAIYYLKKGYIEVDSKRKGLRKFSKDGHNDKYVVKFL